MTVKIFSTTTCPICKMQKAYLDEKGIVYENVFVDQDAAALDEMMKLCPGCQGVPFTVITRDDGSTVQIMGFDKAKLNSELGITG